MVEGVGLRVEGMWRGGGGRGREVEGGVGRREERGRLVSR